MINMRKRDIFLILSVVSVFLGFFILLFTLEEVRRTYSDDFSSWEIIFNQLSVYSYIGIVIMFLGIVFFILTVIYGSKESESYDKELKVTTFFNDAYERSKKNPKLYSSVNALEDCQNSFTDDFGKDVYKICSEGLNKRWSVKNGYVTTQKK